MIVRCQSFYAACHMVANSDLVMVISRFFGHTLKDQLNFCMAELPLRLPLVEAFLYWPKACDQSPAHVWLREFILRLSKEYTEEHLSIIKSAVD